MEVKLVWRIQQWTSATCQLSRTKQSEWLSSGMTHRSGGCWLLNLLSNCLLHFSCSLHTLSHLLRKVYGILSVQLLVTFGFVLSLVGNQDAVKFAQGNPWILWVSLGVSLVSIFTLSCCGDFRRRFPQNFICLGIFTIAQSIPLGIISATMDTKAIYIAVAITAVICVSLTIFAWQTKIDFTLWSGALFIALIVFMLCGIIMAFVPRDSMMQIVYSGLGALLFSFFLLIDTQMIVGGVRSVQISPEEYILAVITLYLDILNIFLYILRIVNGSRA